MIDITLAKIGRSTKKWENRMPDAPQLRALFGIACLLCRWRGRRRCWRRGRRRDLFDLAVLGRDFSARPSSLQAVDDDPVGRREPGADYAQAVHHRTELDQLGADGAVVGDR